MPRGWSSSRGTRRAPRHPPRPRLVAPPMRGYALILFDGECGLCSRLVRFVAARDRAGRFRFVSLQGEAGRRECARLGVRLPAGAPDSIVLTTTSMPGSCPMRSSRSRVACRGRGARHSSSARFRNPSATVPIAGRHATDSAGRARGIGAPRRHRSCARACSSESRPWPGVRPTHSSQAIALVVRAALSTRSSEWRMGVSWSPADGMDVCRSRGSTADNGIPP